MGVGSKLRKITSSMKRFALSALASLAVTAPSYAQMTDASCAVSWGLISNLMTLLQEVTPSIDGGACVVRDLEVMNGRVRILVDVIRWELDGLEALLVSGSLLDRAEIHARGIYVVASTGMPDFDYMLEAQARATEGIGLDLLATHEDGQVLLEQLHVDFPGENAIDATLRLDTVDPRRPETALLSDLRLELLTHGLFETYALMPLGNLLLSTDEDPAAQVDRLRAEAIAAIGTLPEPLFNATSRQALTLLVEDMPNPAGRVVLDLQSDQGLPITQLSGTVGPFGWIPVSDPLAVLQGVDLDITYDRSGAE